MIILTPGLLLLLALLCFRPLRRIIGILVLVTLAAGFYGVYEGRQNRAADQVHQNYTTGDRQ